MSKQKIIDYMADEIIKRYGFEHPVTIRFCKIIDTSNNLVLIKKIYQQIIKEG